MPHRNGHGIDFLLSVNAENAALFGQQQKARQLYRKRYQTEIGSGKCSDGRVGLSTITNTPIGIFQPFRNIGGRLSLAWPLFQRVILDWRDYAAAKGRDSLFLSTYHFSRSNNKVLGCAGWGCDLEEARQFSTKLKREFDQVFDSPCDTTGTRLVSIKVGIDTDFGALILHGDDDAEVDLAETELSGDEEIRAMLFRIYPKIGDTAPNVLDDLVPIVKGNLAHVARTKKNPQHPENLRHRETVFMLGRGFDWMDIPNYAVIVGPWELPNPSPIRTAAGILSKNLRDGIIETPVLLTSGIYRRNGEEQKLAVMKALWLKGVALEIINSEFKELGAKLQTLVTAMDLNTRKLIVVERSH